MSSKAHRAAARKDHFAKGGTAQQWMMMVGAGRHGDTKTKAYKNKKACRGKIRP